MPKRDKTVFLLRNSDPSQDMSVDSQREQCELFARESQLDVLRTIAGVSTRVFSNGAFIDESISGARTDRRAGFRAMLRACQAPTSRIRFVLCYDVNRFGRFGSDEAGHYRYVLKQVGTEVLYVAEGLRGDDADDLVVGVKQWQGRQYLKDLSKVTQRGMIRLAERGFWIGGTPPFGFDLRYADINGTALYVVRFMADGSKHMLNLDGSLQRIIPRGEQIVRGSSDRARLWLSDAERVTIVREIFALYASGFGYKRIAELLNRRGIPAPRDGNWSKRHKPGWSHGTIRNIIENPAYVGHAVYNRSSFSQFFQITGGSDGPRSVPVPAVRAHKITKLPKRDWIVSENAHAALITTELWDRSQAARNDRRKPHARGSNSDYVFTGLIDCKVCNHHFQGHTWKKGKPRTDGTKIRTRGYVCGGYVSKGTAVCPQRWTVNEDLLWRTLLNVIADQYRWLCGSRGFAKAIKERAAAIMSRPAASGPEPDDLRKRMQEIDGKLDALIDNLNPRNLAMLDRKLTALRKEREAFQEQIERAEVQPHPSQSHDADRIKKAARAVRDAFRTIEDASPKLKRRFMREFVDRIELDPRIKKGVAWVWRLPTSVLDSLGLPVSRIAGAGLEPATSGL